MSTVETRRQVHVSRRDSGVAFLLLDCPGKLNTLGTPVMRELVEALDLIGKDDSIKAIVIMSGKADNFVIGADLFEIRKLTSAEELHKLSRDGQLSLNRIACLDIPVVVAINGACLGGGLELALTGHWRIASDEPMTQLGLPETRLGIIPGLGGTQRLPRLVGLKAALGLVLSADPIGAEEAKQIGLVDEVVSSADLMEAAEKRAVALGNDRTPVAKRMSSAREVLTPGAGAAGNESTPYCLPDVDAERAAKLFAMTERSIRIKTRGNYPAQTRVLEVMKLGIEKGIYAGLEAEAKAFGELAGSEVAANLIALFFATDFSRQSAASLAAKFDQNTKVVGIVGGGTMGSSIAHLSAAHGLNVVIRVNQNREKETMENVKALAPRLKDVAPDTYEVTDRVRCVNDYSGLSGAELVLEAVLEDLPTKLEVLKQIEASVGEECVIASNTSSLPLSELSAALAKNDRFVGLHFFHPVDKMPLVEIVALKSTSRKALARAADVITKLGKIPVMVKDGPGFLLNRLLTCYMLESARMAEEGVPLDWIEEAARDFGMPMGPCEVIDEVGCDLAFRVAETLNEAYGERMALPSLLNEIQALGIVGKKTGFGIYLWDEETGRRKEFNPKLSEVPALRFASEKADAATKKLLAERIIFPMIDEAARCLEDKIVMKPREIDMAIIHGIGFPPFRGGLLKYADHVGLKEISAKLRKIYENDTRTVAPLIDKYVAEGRGFYSRAGKEEE